MNRKQMGQAIEFMQVHSENKRLNQELNKVRRRLESSFGTLKDYKHTPYTSWHVLVRMKDGVPVECELLDEHDEKYESEEYPQFDLILPIPNPDSLPEFTGF